MIFRTWLKTLPITRQITKQAVNRLFLQIKWGKNSRYFVGVFNKTIIPLALVGYEMIKANSVAN